MKWKSSFAGWLGRAGHPPGPESASVSAGRNPAVWTHPKQTAFLSCNPNSALHFCFPNLTFPKKKPTLFVTRPKVMCGHRVTQQVAKPQAAVKRKWISKYNQNREADGCAPNTSCFQIAILCVSPATETNTSCNPWIWSLVPAAQLPAGWMLERERSGERWGRTALLYCAGGVWYTVIFLTEGKHKSLSDSEPISPVPLFCPINHTHFKKAGRQEEPRGHQLAVQCW